MQHHIIDDDLNCDGKLTSMAKLACRLKQEHHQHHHMRNISAVVFHVVLEVSAHLEHHIKKD